MRLLPVPICLLVIIACGQQPAHDPEKRKVAIIQADKDMSELAAKTGFNSSILAYANSAIIKLDDERSPIIGKTAFAASFSKDHDTKTISWYPLNAEVARSGELGYTWGNWKVALDEGNNTPKPQ